MTEVVTYIGWTALALATAWGTFALLVFVVERIAGHVRLLRLLSKAIYRQGRKKQREPPEEINPYPDVTE